MKPKDWRSANASCVFLIASFFVAAKKRMSSKYIRNLIDFFLRKATNGFNIFVKILGAEHGPYGRALN